MRYAARITDLIGGTPLVRLNAVTAGLAATVLAKAEFLNPGGSAKDRIAARMIAAAEASGELAPGGTIVEPTSGNTGVGLALFAAQRGYSAIFVVPDKVAPDKIRTLEAYGARVEVTPTAVAPDDPRSYYSVAARLAAEIPGAYRPNQFANPNGPRAHYETTGPEVWADTDGRVTHFVASVGTGGTITGAGRYLRERGVRVVGADPAGSVYSGGTGRPYLVEGVGEDMWPASYDPAVPHEVLAVDDAEAFALTRRLAREEGLLVGGSSGLAVAAALRVARGLPADAVVVALLPDSGRGYLGKIFDDGWMSDHGFALAGDGAAPAAPRRAGSLGALLAGAGLADPAALPHLPAAATLGEAAAAFAATELAALPLLSVAPPARLGEVVGAVRRRDVARALGPDPAADRLARPVAGLATDPLPLVGAGAEADSVAARRLGAHEALLVAERGAALAVLDRALAARLRTRGLDPERG